MMKKTIIILSSILLLVILGLLVEHFLFKHTPESALKTNFNISLKNFDYSVKTFEEEWSPNGDGYLLAVYEFKELTTENINYLKEFDFKKLPISKKYYSFLVQSEIPKQYLKIDSGYYIYGSLSDQDVRNFKVLIVDLDNKTAILYYQYM